MVIGGKALVLKRIELKPCSCGGEAIWIKLYTKNRYDCFIKCLNCGKETRVYTSRQNAAKVWNKLN